MRFLDSGIFSGIMYVVIMAMSVVWIGKLGSYFHESFMLFVVSTSAIVFYNFLNVGSLKKVYGAVKQYPLIFTALSVTFASTWWLTFYSATHASPRATIVVLYLVLAILGCFFSKKYMYAAACTLALIVSIFILDELTLITTGTTLGAGVSCYAYMNLTGLYAKKGQLSGSQVLAVRFYLLAILSGSYILFFGHYYFWAGWTATDYVSHGFSLLLLIIFNLLPNYYAQKGVMQIEASKFSQIISVTPLATYILEGVFMHNWGIGVLVICAVVSGLLIYSNRRKL